LLRLLWIPGTTSSLDSGWRRHRSCRAKVDRYLHSKTYTTHTRLLFRAGSNKSGLLEVVGEVVSGMEMQDMAIVAMVPAGAVVREAEEEIEEVAGAHVVAVLLQVGAAVSVTRRVDSTQ